MEGEKVDDFAVVAAPAAKSIAWRLEEEEKSPMGQSIQAFFKKKMIRVSFALLEVEPKQLTFFCRMTGLLLVKRDGFSFSLFLLPRRR